MKRHPLALMITLALLQGACSKPEYSNNKPQVPVTPIEQQAKPLPAQPVTEKQAAVEAAPELAKEKQASKSDIADALADLRDFDSVASQAPSTGGGLQKNSGESVNISRQMMASRATGSASFYSAPSSSGFGGSVVGGKGSNGYFSLSGKMAPAPDMYAMPREQRDKFDHFSDNPIKQVAADPVSTFSLDVDTGSYALVRQFINQGRLPASDAVRTEELINYFRYDYPKAGGEHPFAVATELSTAPWQPEHYLLRIGVQAQDSHVADMPPANLVFLVDVSGSMDEPNKLPLVISSLQMLSQQLRPQDKVSLVVYAGRTEVVLEPTSGDKKADIQAALGRLQAGGSTAGASALSLAYKMARKGYVANGINRILLATDGDFNVGVTDTNQIKDMVKHERESGITLSTLGFGQGNFNDAMMEQIADVGNGNYSYIDSLNEARKVLVEELSSTFNTVAKDVKVQVEFNPAQVSEYRLIGYENRQLKREDFNNDQVDAGDVGAGKSVTAIYEITPASAAPAVDPLRYDTAKPAVVTAPTGELAFLKIRYKKPNADKSILMSQPIALPKTVQVFDKSSENQRFATAVAGFGQLLRQSTQVKNLSYQQIVAIAQQAKGSDPTGTKGEFIQLVKNAQSLKGAFPNNTQAQTSDKLEAGSFGARRTTEDIRRVFDQNGARLNNSYQRALKDYPNMEGTIRVKLTIDASGKVLSCEMASSDLDNPELEAKIVALVKGFNFGNASVAVWKGTYPLNFYPN